MKFILDHPFFLLTVAAIVCTIIFHLPFGTLCLILLGLFILFYVTRLGTALGWTGYMIDGTFKNRKLSRVFYNLSLKHNSKCGPALIDYGLTNLREFNYPLALELLERAIQLPKLNPMFRKLAETDLAIAYWKNGRIDDAIAWMEKQLKKYEFFSDDFYATTAFFYLEKGNFEKAIEFTDKALKSNENSAAAYDNLGQIALRQNNLTEARKHFTHALSLKETLVDSLYNMGLICEEQEEYEDAASYFAAAHKAPITGLNTVTPQQIQVKYDEYFSENANPAPDSASIEKSSPSGSSSSAAPRKKVVQYSEEELNDIEKEER